MPAHKTNTIPAAFLSVAFHLLIVGAIWAASGGLAPFNEIAQTDDNVIFLELVAQPPESVSSQTEPPLEVTETPPDIALPAVTPEQIQPDRRASMAAPPPPSAQEWTMAATYTLKNSKRYRHNWGQQVRSMMGTAFEGPDQGQVRFRVEIAPDGSLARLDTLWSTSPVAEQRARQAVLQMPQLPPTPTGKPLVFERTISFQPFDAGWPPLYENDCEPDPPAFRNPFAWDGQSAQTRKAAMVQPPVDPAALEECMKQLPKDSLDAQSAAMVRQFEQWQSHKLDR